MDYWIYAIMETWLGSMMTGSSLMTTSTTTVVSTMDFGGYRRIAIGWSCVCFLYKKKSLCISPVKPMLPQERLSPASPYIKQEK